MFRELPNGGAERLRRSEPAARSTKYVQIVARTVADSVYREALHRPCPALLLCRKVFTSVIVYNALSSYDSLTSIFLKCDIFNHTPPVFRLEVFNGKMAKMRIYRPFPFAKRLIETQYVTVFIESFGLIE